MAKLLPNFNTTFSNASHGRSRPDLAGIIRRPSGLSSSQVEQGVDTPRGSNTPLSAALLRVIAALRCSRPWRRRPSTIECTCTVTGALPCRELHCSALCCSAIRVTRPTRPTRSSSGVALEPFPAAGDDQSSARAVSSLIIMQRRCEHIKGMQHRRRFRVLPSCHLRCLSVGST